MPDLADLFPGYASEWINTRSGRIFARVGGNGPPLLLLHGFSQTHVQWYRVAPQLADRFTLIIADLPGYGWSDMPESDKEHTPYTKRAMANTMIEVLDRVKQAAIIAVDVPIGLPDSGARGCALEARQILRKPRSASVFPAPVLPTSST